MNAGRRTLQLHPADNVAIALEEGLADGVAIGHKIALRPIAVGESIVKFGQLVHHSYIREELQSRQLVMLPEQAYLFSVSWL